MRWLLLGIGCVALAGCSKAPDRSEPAGETMVAADAPAGMVAARAPGIDVTAAPGVAFAYRYGFRLPSERIAAVQEAHAQACERLGVARCRITGMRYRLLGEHDIEGQLLFKLAPELARGFGRQGIDGVEKASGTLVDAEITGTDAGAAIDRAGVERGRAADELKRLDDQLARARTAAERAELQAQRAEIARRLAAAGDAAGAARESLATTLVAFLYESGPAVRGFDSSAPLTSALDAGIGSMQATLAVVLAIVAVLGPPALVALTAFLLWRRFRPRASAAAPPAD